MKNFIKVFSLALVLGGGAFFIFTLSQVRSTVPRILNQIFSEDATDRFRAYATSISGQQNLHVARLNRMEVYERTSSAQAFGFSLPEVVVSLTFPVEYNYSVGLTAAWRFEKRQQMLWVYAPELSGLTPAVNVSQMKFEIKKGSILRDETQVKERLQKELTGYLAENSIALREEVREEARKAVETFVRQWVASQFGQDATGLPIRVLFPGETANAVPPSSDP